MRGRFKIPSFTMPFVALASLPVLANAQSLNTWSLPEPDATTAPKAEGPVDPQNPIVRPTTPEPTPTPTPIPTITPLPVPSTTVTAAPIAETPARPTQAPGAAAGPRPEVASGTSQQEAAPSPTATLPEPAPSPAPVPQQSSVVPDEGGIASTPPAGTAWPLWWWALPAILVAAIAAALLLFRRRRPEALEWEETTEPQPSANAEAPAAAPEPEVAPAPPPAPPLPTPAFSPSRPAPAQDDITLALEPVTMRLSLFYATLQYRLCLRASSSQPALKVMGDMISAHASLTHEEQLAPQPDNLPALHSLPGLAAGEKVELRGEIQLPLTAIRALRQGGGSFLVPLARFCLVTESGNALRRVFTVGLRREGTGLAPLRIDAGPRDFTPLAASEIETARQFPIVAGSLPLDPQRAAG